MRNLLVALIALSAVSFATARAHTPLASSAPGNGASVAAPVEELMLEFREPVRLTAVTLADSSGKERALGAVPTEIAARFTLAVRDDLAPGDYSITWRAVGADTHIVSGEVRFTVTASPVL